MVRRDVVFGNHNVGSYCVTKKVTMKRNFELFDGETVIANSLSYNRCHEHVHISAYSHIRIFTYSNIRIFTYLFVYGYLPSYVLMLFHAL